MVTAAPGWMVDPSNSNAVVPVSTAAVNNPNANSTNKSAGFLSSEAGQDLVVKKQSTLNDTLTQRAAITSGAKPQETQPAQEQPLTLLSPDGSQEETYTTPNANKDLVNSRLSSGYSVGGGSVPSSIDTGSDPQVAKLKEESTQAQSQVDSIISQMGTLLISDAQVQTQVNGITAKFSALKQQMQKTNDSRLASYDQLGYRLGTTQYSPLTQVGIHMEEAQQGVMRIAELDAEEQDAINKAQSAQRSNNWTVFSKMMDYYDGVRKDKDQALADLNKNAVEAQKLLLQSEQNDREQARFAMDQRDNDLGHIASQLSIIPDFETHGDDIKQLSQLYGIPPEEIIAATRQQQVKDQKAQLDLFQGRAREYAGAMQGGLIPQGTSYDNWLAEFHPEDALDLKLKNAQIAKTNQDIQKSKQEMQNEQGINTTPETKPYVDAFNSAATNLTAAQMKAAQSNFNSLIQSNDLDGARNYIIRVAMAGAPVDQQNQAIGRSQALAAMKDIQDLLDEAKSKGATTNIISGSIVKAAQNLGTTNNPDLTYIASRIQQELQVYRRAMTGVAFSPGESGQYKAIFPDTTNVDKLNTTKIAALTDALNSNNRATLSFLIGDSNYNSIFGGEKKAKLPNSEGSQERVKVTSPDGKQTGSIPKAQLEQALKDGYKQI